MLKFNIKEHKLEELEKYGFEKEDDCYLYFNHIFIIYLDSYKFIIDNDYFIEEKDLFILYDLIKDGLIIKE